METTWVNFSISNGLIRNKDRSKIGLCLHITARKEVEDYMRALASNQTSDVAAFGDAWVNKDPTGEPLRVYMFDYPLATANRYTLDAVGASPLIAGERTRVGLQEDVVNLSFMRLVGIGSETGVSVALTGAYSSEYVQRLKNTLLPATRSFLQDYIVPVTINLQIVSRS